MPTYGAKAKEWDVKEVGKFIASYTKCGQYRETFEDNFINGKRLLRLKSTHLPQLGVQRYDHIKHLWAKIKHIQDVAAEYESMMSDPDKMVDFAAVRIQSLARGKLDRHRVADIKQARLEKQQELFEHTAEGVLLEEEKLMDEIDAIEASYEDAHALAALKIQQRARGMRDRRRVEELKTAGKLPGQRRAEEAAHSLLDDQDVQRREAAAIKLQARGKGMIDRKRVEVSRANGVLPGQARQQRAAAAHVAGEFAPPGSPQMELSPLTSPRNAE